MPFAGLPAAVNQIPDPCRRQGQRYRLAPLLLFTVLAILAGAPAQRRIRLGIGVHRERLNATCGARFCRAAAVTTRRALWHALDPAAIAAAVRRHAEHLGDAATPPGGRVIAREGKTLRGSVDHLDDPAAAQPLSAFASEAALILAPQESAPGDEIAAAQALIEPLALGGILFTANARHGPTNLRRRRGDRQRAAGAGEGQPASPAGPPSRRQPTTATPSTIIPLVARSIAGARSSPPTASIPTRGPSSPAWRASPGAAWPGHPHRPGAATA